MHRTIRRVLPVVVLLLLLVDREALAGPDPVQPSSGDVTRAAARATHGDGVDGWVESRPRLAAQTGWALGIKGAWLNQFETDIDGGGRMAVDRLLLRAAISYSPRPGLPITLNIGYRFDGYAFDGTGDFGAAPWGDVHSLRASIPLGFPVGKRWFAFALPTVRTTVEDGAALEDGVTWGIFAGAAWKASDRLRIGPGFGVMGELEDAVSIFPVLFVDWRIRPTLSLKTGGGLGATQGPGLFLEWRPKPCWQISFGGRYERVRFRLDDHGVAPGGIGQETALTLLVAARYELRQRGHLTLSFGSNFIGSLRLEDQVGNLIVAEDHDPAFFFGVGFGWRF